MATVQRVWTVGRADDCDVRVTDEYASPHNCQVALLADGTYVVRDLGSTNGTWIRPIGRHWSDGTRVTDWTPITPGSILRVGRSDIPWQG